MVSVSFRKFIYNPVMFLRFLHLEKKCSVPQWFPAFISEDFPLIYGFKETGNPLECREAHNKLEITIFLVPEELSVAFIAVLKNE